MYSARSKKFSTIYQSIEVCNSFQALLFLVGILSKRVGVAGRALHPELLRQKLSVLNLTLEIRMKPIEGVIPSATDIPIAALLLHIDSMMLIENPT